MSAPALSVHNLTKKFGDLAAVQDLSFEVPAGSVFGLLGRNGAGKSTTIKSIMTLVRPTEGEIRVFDEPVTHAAMRRISYLQESPLVPEYHTGTTFLKMTGMFYGIPKGMLNERIARVIDLVDLRDFANQRIRKYSKGMRQKVAFASALINDAELYLFDEPTEGLDPVMRKVIHDMISSLKKAGKTVMLSSHILSDIETTCDNICIIEKGKVVLKGSVNEIMAVQDIFVIRAGGDRALMLSLAKNYSPNADIDEDGEIVIECDIETANKLLDDLRRNGFIVQRFVAKQRSLEEIFISQVGTKKFGKPQ